MNEAAFKDYQSRPVKATEHPPIVQAFVDGSITGFVLGAMVGLYIGGIVLPSLVR